MVNWGRSEMIPWNFPINSWTKNKKVIKPRTHSPYFCPWGVILHLLTNKTAAEEEGKTSKNKLLIVASRYLSRFLWLHWTQQAASPPPHTPSMPLLCTAATILWAPPTQKYCKKFMKHLCARPLQGRHETKSPGISNFPEYEIWIHNIAEPGNIYMKLLRALSSCGWMDPRAGANVRKK